MKLFEIVLHAGFAEQGGGDHTTADIADGQAVGAGDTVNMIGRFAATATVHVLMHHHGIARNIFMEKRRDGTHAEISCSSGGATMNDRDSLALIVGSLSARRAEK